MEDNQIADCKGHNERFCGHTVFNVSSDNIFIPRVKGITVYYQKNLHVMTYFALHSLGLYLQKKKRE